MASSCRRCTTVHEILSTHFFFENVRCDKRKISNFKHSTFANNPVFFVVLLTIVSCFQLFSSLPESDPKPKEAVVLVDQLLYHRANHRPEFRKPTDQTVSRQTFAIVGTFYSSLGFVVALRCNARINS